MGIILSPETRKSVYKFVLISDLKQRIKKLTDEKKMDDMIMNLLMNKYPVCDNCKHSFAEYL